MPLGPARAWGVTLCAANALVITALFDFPQPGMWLRLAVHFLVRTRRTVGTALLLAAAAGITAVFSEAVLGDARLGARSSRSCASVTR